LGGFIQVLGWLVSFDVRWTALFCIIEGNGTVDEKVP
jgi:hypothetical protein